MSIDPPRTDGLLWRYLPAEFGARLPTDGGGWRGRTALLLWALGYPLEMAWALAMDRDAAASLQFEESIAKLDDNRLIKLLEATSKRRGDGRHLHFVSAPTET